MNDEQMFDSEDMLPIPVPEQRPRRRGGPAAQQPAGSVIVRVAESPLDLLHVWKLWTTPEGLERWWWPHVVDATYRLNPQPGGLYSFHSQMANIGVEGCFLEVLPPQSLTLTWQWMGDPSGPDVVHVHLVAQPAGGCQVQVRHETLSSNAAAYERGWGEVLGRLAGLTQPVEAQGRISANG